MAEHMLAIVPYRPPDAPAPSDDGGQHGWSQAQLGSDTQQERQAQTGGAGIKRKRRMVGKQHPLEWVPMVRQEAREDDSSHQVRTGRVDNAVQEAIQEVEGRCAVILEHELPVHTAALTSILLTLPWDYLNNNRAVNGKATRGFSLGLRRVGAFVTKPVQAPADVYSPGAAIPQVHGSAAQLLQQQHHEAGDGWSLRQG